MTHSLVPTSSVRAFSLMLLIAAVALAPASNAWAGSVFHGDFADPDGEVMFLDVEESSDQSVPPERFGEPTPLGDSLLFNPQSFSAQAVGGGADLIDVQLNTIIMAQPGSTIESLTFSEFGDYQLLGLGSADALAAASLNVFVTVLEVDGVSADSLDLDPIDASDSFIDQLSLSGLVLDGTFSLEVDIDLSAELVEQGVVADFGVTKVSVALDNRLTTLADTGATSFIQKKGFTIDVGTETPIPEPATAVTLVVACGLAGFARRQRR